MADVTFRPVQVGQSLKLKAMKESAEAKGESVHYATVQMDVLTRLQQSLRIPAEILDSCNHPKSQHDPTIEYEKMRQAVLKQTRDICFAVAPLLKYPKEWMHYVAPVTQKPKRKSLKGPVCKKRDATKRKGGPVQKSNVSVGGLHNSNEGSCEVTVRGEAYKQDGTPLLVWCSDNAPKGRE